MRHPKYPAAKNRHLIAAAWRALQQRSRNASKGQSYADDALLIQSVIAGQGLAIVRDVYAAHALKTGNIVLAIDARVPTKAGYFIVTHPKKLDVPKIAAFRRWIIGKAGAA